MLRDEIRAIPVTPGKLRSFGLLIGGVLGLIAAVVYWRGGAGALALLSGGVALAVIGLARPAWLRCVYIPWMGLALVLGFVMTRVLLTLVFVALFVPMGLLMRAFGRDPLKRTLDRSAPSYWTRRSRDDTVREHLERYY